MTCPGTDKVKDNIEDCNDLHVESDFFEFFLHALNRTGEGIDPCRGAAKVVAGDAVSATGQEGADELGGLPCVEASLLKLLAEFRQVSGREFFHLYLFVHFLNSASGFRDGNCSI
jgi:hypothetical protein